MHFDLYSIISVIYPKHMSCWIFWLVIENETMIIVVGTAVVIVLIQVYNREIKKSPEDIVHSFFQNDPK